eukprot:2553237-Rhodomonas_salina.3
MPHDPHLSPACVVAQQSLLADFANSCLPTSQQRNSAQLAETERTAHLPWNCCISFLAALATTSRKPPLTRFLPPNCSR